MLNIDTGDKKITEYFKNIFSKTETNMGRIDDANLLAEGKMCGDNRDMLSLFGIVVNGKIVKLRYICRACDPFMYVAADILCRLADDRARKEVDKLSEVEFGNLLGAVSQTGYDHFIVARKILSRAMRKLEIL